MPPESEERIQTNAPVSCGKAWRVWGEGFLGDVEDLMTKSDEALLARVGKFWQTLNELLGSRKSRSCHELLMFSIQKGLPWGPVEGSVLESDWLFSRQASNRVLDEVP